MNEFKENNRYLNACLALPPHLYGYLARLPEDIQKKAQEIRLRINRPVAVCCNDNTYYLTENGCFTNTPLSQPMLIVSRRDLSDTFQNVCNYSVYSRQNEIKNGFVTMQGGHRAGICGTAVISNDEITNIRDISTISIRIAREIIGCSESLLKTVGNNFGGLLICGAPCSGKTTVLRDIARALSLSENKKTVIIDSRGEIAGTSRGVFQNDIGMCDVLDGYPRNEGILHAIRSLSPDYIVCDEIGTAQDVAAIEQSINSGVKFIATIHTDSAQELMKKQFGRKLLEMRAFEKIAFLYSREKAGKIKEVINCEDLLNG